MVLSVPSEVTWRAPSLRVSAADSPLDLAAVARIEAVRLFVERAALADPAFRLTEDNAAVVIAICRRWTASRRRSSWLPPASAEAGAGSCWKRRPDAPEAFCTGVHTGDDGLPATNTSNTIQWSYDLPRPPNA